MIRRFFPFFNSLALIAAGCLPILCGCANSPLPLDEAVEISLADGSADDAAADIFQRIKQGFAIPDIDDKLVRQHQAGYLGNPDGLRRMLERSRPYLFHIVDEIEKRKFPMELALLPLVESGYNPMAYSRSRASGLWQFIPATGKHYRLNQTWWQDERRDILASTSAALDYFEMLYETHDDWHLALASYNWGHGAVGRAVIKNRMQGLPADYLSLPDMPEETRNYLPKLQALKNIFRDTDVLASLSMPPIPNQPYFDVIDRTPNIDVKLAADFAGLSEQEFLTLNPAHNRPVIVSELPILIPRDRIKIFSRRVREHIGEGKPLASWQIHTLTTGERLEEVARRFKMPLADLMAANEIGKDFETQPGISLLVAGNTGGKALNDKTLALSLRFPPGKRDGLTITGRVYTIQKGDSLERIARRSGVSVMALQRRNKLRGDFIVAGQRLMIPREEGRKLPTPRAAHDAVAKS